MQEQIIKLLRREKKPLSRTEIANKLGERDVKISACIKRLLKHREIKCIELDRNQARKYNAQRRMRLYYV